MDGDELLRRALTETINEQTLEREVLEKRYGQVWDTKQLTADFQVLGFMAPFVRVTRKSDDMEGALIFQHAPRYYWNFQEVKDV